MSDEPELGQSADPRELVRGDVEAVRTTVDHLTDLAAGFGATADGLRAIDVGAWTGAAADSFRRRFAEAPAQWARAATAFGSAAQAWERFRSTSAAAQDEAAAAVARFRAGAAASERAHADHAAELDHYRERLALGQNPGLEPVLDDTGAGEMELARRMLADARARRDAAAADAAQAIAEAAALSPDPPTDWDRRITEVADGLGASGIELAHVAEGVGEGLEGLVQMARTVNPADPYNVNHPGRFVENASAALSGAVGTLAHPLRMVTGLVGAGWRSDPARAYGHLLPAAAALGASAGGRSVFSAARDAAGAGRSAVNAAGDAARVPETSAGGPARDHAATEGAQAPEPVRAPRGMSPGRGGARRPRRSLWVDPRPTAPPFAPRPEPGSAPSGAGRDALADADRAAAAHFDGLGRDRPSRPDMPVPKDVAPPVPTPTRPTGAKVRPVPQITVAADERDPVARAPDPTRRRGRPPEAAARPPDALHDPERARQARVTRSDKDFVNLHNRHGTRKSHLDAQGDLVPANPDGAASVVEHVVGRRSPVKGESPYSSFTSPGAHAAVDFGGHTIEVDVVRLQADVDAGLLPGVEILPPHRVQAAIQADADRIAGCPVDLYVRRGHVAAAARSYGLGARATEALRQRMIDMANAQRHHEWMIRGVVPGRYIVGPHSEGRHG